MLSCIQSFDCRMMIFVLHKKFEIKFQVTPSIHTFWATAASRDDDYLELPGTSNRERVIQFTGKIHRICKNTKNE